MCKGAVSPPIPHAKMPSKDEEIKYKGPFGGRRFRERCGIRRGTTLRFGKGRRGGLWLLLTKTCPFERGFVGLISTARGS